MTWTYIQICKSFKNQSAQRLGEAYQACSSGCRPGHAGIRLWARLLNTHGLIVYWGRSSLACAIGGHRGPEGFPIVAQVRIQLRRCRIKAAQQQHSMCQICLPRIQCAQGLQPSTYTGSLCRWGRVTLHVAFGEQRRLSMLILEDLQV